MVGTRNGPRFSAACGVLVCAGGLALAGSRGAGAASVVVPTNQFIPVALTATLNSATAHVGDTFTFTTTKKETLGTLVVPKGTPGHGRLAVARPADAKHHGQLALQADSLDLPDGDTVWVNSDPGSSPRAHLAGKAHIVILPVPIPIGVGPGETGVKAGDLIIDSGTTFNVVTIPPRPSPAPLVTATPTPVPTATATPTPAPTATATPAASPEPAAPSVAPSAG